MKNIPDELFRRKLEQLQTPPPARAWERIEKGMRRKRITPWLAIAASLLLAITASAVILTRQTDPAREIADQKLPETHKQTETQATPDTPKADEETPPTENNSDTQVADERDVKSVPSTPNVPRDILDETVASNTRPHVTETTPLEEEETTIDVASAIEDSIPTLIADASEDHTPVKIVLEADEVQARYLKKKTKDDATEDVAKASGLRKLLDKAEQIQNQDPIGDLRQMKNEIFALNFPGKKRDQNK